VGTFISRESQLQVDSSNNLLTATYFVDTNGSTQALKFNAEAPQVCAQDYLQCVAEGDIDGHSASYKLGYAVSLANLEVDLFQFAATGTASYVFPTSNMALQVVSSDVQDHTTGTGIRTVTIGYLDTGYVAKTTTANLNGTVAVLTDVADIFRVNRVRALTVGTSSKAAGNIHVRSTGGLIYGGIMAGYTRGRTAIYTVPTSKTFYMTSIKFSSISGSKVAASLFTERATYNDESNINLTPGKFFMPMHEIGIQDGAFNIPLEIPAKYPQGTDIKVSAKSDQAGAILTCAFRGWTE
jgi:hypothetical protein